MSNGHGLLNGKKGIVFGPLDDMSIGWAIALAAHREGATLAISNTQMALRLGAVQDLARLVGPADGESAPLVICDVSDDASVEAAMVEAKAKLGRLDFVVHCIGYSKNIRKALPYEKLNYGWFRETLDISGVSLHKVISAGLKADALADGASIVAITFIAAQRVFGDYTDMAEAKAVLESVARSFGARLGERKIRVNTVSQSPTRTRAANGIPGVNQMFAFAEALSPLGNATSDECGDYVVTLLSDLTRKVTMQNLFHDGGFSAMGVSEKLLSMIQLPGTDEPTA